MPNVTLHLADAKLVDHTTMDKPLHTQREFANAGRKLEITGLDQLRPFGRTASSGRMKAGV
jgi:hypothetical protein